MEYSGKSGPYGLRSKINVTAFDVLLLRAADIESYASHTHRTKKESN
jgi:hypothetical protein